MKVYICYDEIPELECLIYDKDVGDYHIMNNTPYGLSEKAYFYHYKNGRTLPYWLGYYFDKNAFKKYKQIHLDKNSFFKKINFQKLKLHILKSKLAK